MARFVGLTDLDSVLLMRHRELPHGIERRPARFDDPGVVAVLAALDLAIPTEDGEADHAVIEYPVRVAGYRQGRGEPPWQPPDLLASRDIDRFRQPVLPPHVIRYRLGNDPRPPHPHAPADRWHDHVGVGPVLMSRFMRVCLPGEPCLVRRVGRQVHVVDL